MPRSPLIVANWKMQLIPSMSAKVAKDIVKGAPRASARVVLCPSFPALVAVSKIVRGNVVLGAQDVYFLAVGAFTGAVSIPMLQDIGCRYVIIGHSERRTFFHESDVDVQKKFDAAAKAKMIPIVCIGETKSERRQGKSEHVIRRELRVALAHAKKYIGPLAIAYEPVWAIGGKGAAAPALISAMHKVVLQECARLLSKQSFSKLDVLYGGSVTPANVADYVGAKKMQGVLVGGASLKAQSFLNIIRAL